MNRKDLQELSRVRLREAKALLDAGLYDGAYYLAGYAVECALKACIAKQTQRHEFPDKEKAYRSYTHEFDPLVTVAKLNTELIRLKKSDPVFSGYWGIVLEWSESSRYEPSTGGRSRLLIEAISDRNHGILTWLRRHW